MIKITASLIYLITIFSLQDIQLIHLLNDLLMANALFSLLQVKVHFGYQAITGCYSLKPFLNFQFLFLVVLAGQAAIVQLPVYI